MKAIFLNIVFLVFFSVSLFAQKNEENSEFKNYSSSLFDSKEKAFSVVSNLNKKEQNKLNERLQSGVQIQQIGDYNKVFATLSSNNTKVAVTQNGDSNTLVLDKNAKTITQSVVQQGSNNKISDYTLSSSYNVHMEMIQKGDNQNITNIGTNSLSKNMKITQTGNGASIILINK